MFNWAEGAVMRERLYVPKDMQAGLELIRIPSRASRASATVPSRTDPSHKTGKGADAPLPPA